MKFQVVLIATLLAIVASENSNNNKNNNNNNPKQNLRARNKNDSPADVENRTYKQQNNNNGNVNRNLHKNGGNGHHGTPPPVITNTAPYVLPPLPYAYDALEPVIDTQTMTIHHDKHHNTYVTNLNAATEGKNRPPVVDLMANAIRAGTAIRNNGGGHYNHAFFWKVMAPPTQAATTQPSDQLMALINSSFGSFDAMETQFKALAAPGSLFGSGWVWLCVTKSGNQLKLVGTPNQDNPLMRGVTDEIMYPILALDVWEHAYYLKYQNLRNDYVSNWWSVINWQQVSDNFAYVIANHAGVSV